MGGVPENDYAILVMIRLRLVGGCQGGEKGLWEGDKRSSCMLTVCYFRTKHNGKTRTLIDISALRGFRWKSVSSACSPMRGSASGKLAWNHLTMDSSESRRSNSVVGAKSVQVNVLSYTRIP